MGTLFEDYWHLNHLFDDHSCTSEIERSKNTRHFRNGMLASQSWRRGTFLSVRWLKIIKNTKIHEIHENYQKCLKILLFIGVLTRRGENRWISRNFSEFRTRRCVMGYLHGPYRGTTPHYPGTPHHRTHHYTVLSVLPGGVTAAPVSSPGSFWLQHAGHRTRSLCLDRYKPQIPSFGGFSE